MILDFGPRTLPRLGKCPVTELFPAFKHISLCVPPIFFVREAIFLLLFFLKQNNNNKKKPLDFLCSETWASVEHLLLPLEVIVLSCAGKEHDVSPQGSWEEPRHLHLCQQTPRWNIQKPVEPDTCTPVPIYLTLWLILGIPRPQSWHSVPMAFESYWVFLALSHSSLVPGHRPGKNPSVWADCAFIWPCLKSEPRCRRSPSVAAHCLPEISDGLSTVQLHSFKLGVLILNVSALQPGSFSV